MRTIIAALVMACCAQVAAAQGLSGVSLRLDAGNVWARSDVADTKTVLNGPALGGEGRVGIGPLFLSVHYLEGRLSGPGPNDGPSVHQDLVQGAIALVAVPTPWLEISAGPNARAYVTDSTNERWIAWQLRGRLSAPILASGLTSYVELWRSVSSTLNVAPGAGRVQGGETGLLYRPHGPLTFSLAYHVDDALFKAPGRSETLEWLSVGVGIGR